MALPRGGGGAGVLAAVVAAVVVVVVLAPSLGYDASWHLAWGREVVEGRRPEGGALEAPTAHPLLLVVMIVLAPLGTAAATAVLVVLVALAVAAVAVGVAVVGRALGLPPVAAVLAGTLAATSPELLRSASFLGSDAFVLAFAATGAAAFATARPRLGVALLCGCALLRPEGWLLLLVAAVWTRRRDAALALIVPLAAWAATGLLVAGDALHGLRGTRALAEALDRPRGLGAAVADFGPGLLAAAGTLTALLGLVVAAVLLQRPGDRRAVLVAPLLLGALAWLALGATGLPLVQRYLLLPGCALALLAATAPLVAPRRAAAAGWIVLAVVVLADGALRVDAAADARHAALAARAEQRALTRLLAEPRVRAALDAAACPVAVAQARLVPDVALRGAQPLDRIHLGAPPGGALVVTPTRPTARSAVLTARDPLPHGPAVAAHGGFAVRDACVR